MNHAEPVIPWRPRPIRGRWTPDQARVAACFPKCRRVVVPAANGVGKTYLAANLVVSFLADLLPAAVAIITSPTPKGAGCPHAVHRCYMWRVELKRMPRRHVSRRGNNPRPTGGKDNPPGLHTDRL